jgi:pyridoxal phosphate enzyme (YggS family)
VQEFSEKSARLADSPYSIALSPAATDPAALSVHLIGHLQSNKSARAAEIFSSVDTVDSLKLAERLAEAARRLGRSLPVLLEIKLSDEETKEGLAPGSPELEALLDRLPELAPHVALRGLMTVAPISSDPAVAEACFQQLAELRNTLARQQPRLCFDELSMGMSGDFEAAIAAGSTLIRVGTAIFGARPKPGTNAAPPA